MINEIDKLKSLSFIAYHKLWTHIWMKIRIAKTIPTKDLPATEHVMKILSTRNI